MLQRSTFQLLRIKFSYFLMPIYWFALSQTPNLNNGHAALIFFILHFLLYPASNGYNSYMDRDTKSIGGLERPLQPTKELFYVSLVLDGMAIIAGILISKLFVLCTVAFIVASRAYSYRGIRLKKYPVTGYITAIFFQGAVVYFMVYHGSSTTHTTDVPIAAMAISSLLVGSFYPLTQVYQHEQDRADGVKSISIMLGYKATFIFSGIVFLFTLAVAAGYFALNLELDGFLVILICTVPAMFYFVNWYLKVRKNVSAANFKNSLLMNIIGASCINLAFIILIIKDKF